MILQPYIKSKNSFEAQKEDEETILIIRRHWFVPFSVFFVFVIFALLPPLIYYFLSKISGFSDFSSFFWFFVIIFFLFWWVALFKKVMSYILTCVILTNKRLIRINTKSFFKYERDEIPLENVQDISVKILGVFGSFFDFGDIEVQSAGAMARFRLTKIPQPQRLKEKIMQVISQQKAGL